MKISDSNIDDDKEDPDADLPLQERILKLLASEPAPVSDKVLETWRRMGQVTIE